MTRVQLVPRWPIALVVPNCTDQPTGRWPFPWPRPNGTWATFAITACVAVSTGLAVSQGNLLFTLALPPLAMWQPDRRRAALAALCYFLAAGNGILHVGPYLEMTGSGFPAICYWMAAAALQSLVWLCAWSGNGRLLRTTAAVLASALPPFGLLSWAHPFHGAGLLFPTMGVVGLLLTVAVLELMTLEPLAVGLVAATALLGHGHAPTNRAEAVHWAGMRTHFGDVFRGDDPLGVMESVRKEIRGNPATVQVWPESIVPHWNEATERFWVEIVANATASGKTLILGSTIGIPDARRTRLRNVAVIKGNEEATVVDQRTPVPGGTWHPLTGEGVPLGLFHSVVRSIGGHRAAFLICYEQLLAWSYISLLFERPTVLVGMANVHWVSVTSIPAVQTACLHSWARLFDVPVVEAVNR